MTLRKLTLVLATAALLSAQADVALQRAIRTETLEGDLKGAIEQYGKLAESGDRAIAAQALIRMAGCYEKLGTAQAREIYERVVKEFGDQAESVTTARARLAALRPKADSMTLRKVDSGFPISSVSADGRFATYTDWTTRGDIAVRDLLTDSNWALTRHEEGTRAWADGSVISPDGRQVGYLWAELHDDEWEFQIRIVAIDGEGSPRNVYRDPTYVQIQSWTPDGQSLLITRVPDDGTSQIATLSLKNGSMRQLKSLEWGRVAASISPDGRWVAYSAPTANGPSTDIFVLAVDGSQEATVVQHPANDNFLIWSPDGSELLFASDRTGTTSLWSVPIKDGKTAGEAELFRSDIGNIVPLRMTQEGTLYYRHSRSHFNIYRAAMGEDGKVSGKPELATDQYVNSNWGAALSPNGQQLAYVSYRPGLVLVVRNLQNGQERVFKVNLRIDGLFLAGPGWLPDGDSLLISGQESQRSGRRLYRVDLDTGTVTAVDVNTRAGFKVTPDGKAVIDEKDGSLVRFDLVAGTETTIQAVSGLDEPAVNPAISPDGRQLAYVVQVLNDATYFYVMPAGGGESRRVFKEALPNGVVVLSSLAWTPDQRYLLFVRRVGQDTSVWRVPVAGGVAEEVGISMEGGIFGPQISPDGHDIFFTVENDRVQNEVWAQENFLPEQRASR